VDGGFFGEFPSGDDLATSGYRNNLVFMLQIQFLLVYLRVVDHHDAGSEINKSFTGNLFLLLGNVH
jgi:hypothetical protein